MTSSTTSPAPTREPYRPAAARDAARPQGGPARRRSRLKRVLQIHNRYRFYGGEDAAVEGLVHLLSAHGIRVTELTGDSAEIERGWLSKLRASVATAGGVYSIDSHRRALGLIDRERPDVAHAHNVYPLLTPAVLAACRKRGVPVVMTCHNYRLVCPIGTHFREGAVCEACVGAREYWCLFNNCRQSLVESAAYALRSSAARSFGLFRSNVTLFIALSRFLKGRLVQAGIPDERVEVLPNAVPLPPLAADPATGTYAAYAGRISPEKGVGVLLEAAAHIPEIPLQVAGAWPGGAQPNGPQAPNVQLVGKLDQGGVVELYHGARFVVMPTLFFEGCPMVLLEAMSHGLPVVASRIGGIPEFVEDGVTGLLCAPGDAGDLAAKIRLLWENPDLCARLGAVARERVAKNYHLDDYFGRLMAVYHRAVELGGSRPTPLSEDHS